MTESETHQRTRPVVYVVDGDPDIRERLRVLLGTLDVQVRLFRSGEQFLAAYSTRASACLITEIDLPGITGRELQGWTLRHDRSLPVIFLSSRRDVPGAVRAIRSGALDFLEKPFVERVLLTRVRQALSLES